MKNKIIIGRIFMFAALFVFALATFASAQNTFRVGDSVTVADGRTGTVESFKGQDLAKVKFGENDSQYFLLQDIKKTVDKSKQNFRVGDKVVVAATNQQGVIESIVERGDGAKVKLGPGKYDFKYVFFKDLITPQAAAVGRERQQDELRQKPMRAQFEDDAKPFFDLIITVAPGFDPKYRLEFSFNPVNATYEKWMKELTTLSVVCQKYPNLMNPLDADKNSIRKNVADWCKIAEQRTAVVKRMKTIVGEQRINSDIAGWTNQINDTLRNFDDGHVSDELQMLLYDRAAWEQKKLKFAKEIYADAGAEMPMKMFAPLNEKADELKAKIESDAPNRSWKQPNFKDAALEALARREVPTDFPGAKVFKTGMDDTTWKVRDDTSLVGSGTGYKLYRTTKGAYRFKLGSALIKLPNQPFCQIREFQVTQYKAGAGFGAAKAWIAGIGVFVKCP